MPSEQCEDCKRLNSKIVRTNLTLRDAAERLADDVRLMAAYKRSLMDAGNMTQAAAVQLHMDAAGRMSRAAFALLHELR